MKVFKLIFTIFVFSSFLSSAHAAQRDKNCVITLDFSNPAVTASTPSCAWVPANGPMEISVYVKNLPPSSHQVDVNLDCLVDSKLAGPLFGLLAPIQGKKSFTHKNGRRFPINWEFQKVADHGNVLIYVDKSSPKASISCKAQLTIMDQGLDVE